MSLAISSLAAGIQALLAVDHRIVVFCLAGDTSTVPMIYSRVVPASICSPMSSCS